MPISKHAYFQKLCKAAVNGTFPSTQGENCLYHGQGKRRCAVGILIPPSLYGDGYEGRCASELPLHLLDRIVPAELDSSDLNDVQYTHDCHALDKKGWNPTTFIRALVKKKMFSLFREEAETFIKEHCHANDEAGVL